ncbi:MAG: FMN-binding protein [Desulfobacterales bacterium]|jgi:Na+-transporting NADH:ubiquinone oxidoreductase subunit C|nr:FMN-binding protein [Desulfobacteraceae bacterium]MBT7087063.1 FMN-binding protein [Desulfobacterales bacterium]MBT7696826.1 FMN-binding protein [Desulfobacterales bacterium]
MKNSLVSIAYMFLITFLFTSLVSAVKFFNEEKILNNEKTKLQKVVLHVLDISIINKADEEILQLFESRIRVKKNLNDVKYYVAYENDVETISGYAFTVGGSGFWGPIEAIVAVDDKLSKIKGISFYKHTETPGLGARITEKWFTKQFEGLSLHPVSAGEKMFYLKPLGSKTDEKDLDAITGATGTSRAVENFLNSELDIILKNFDPLRKG